MAFYSVEIVRADVPTLTGKIYPLKEMYNIISQIKGSSKKMIVYLGFPDFNCAFLDLRMACAQIQDIYIRNNILYADILPLKTVKGQILKEAIDEIRFDLAGVGQYDEENKIKNFELICVTANLKNSV